MHPGCHPHHLGSGTGYRGKLQPACQLLHRQAGRPRSIHRCCENDRGLLASDCQVAAQRKRMTENVRILLVEDDPADAGLIRIALTEADQAPGLELAWVDRLDKALASLAERGADAILLDVNLPDS